MVDKAPLRRSVVRYNGIFDLAKLYNAVYNWIIDEGYYFEEKQYKHKVPSPAGSEQHIKWEGWRKINEYTLYRIKFYFYIINMKEVEVIKDGKKTKLMKGMLQLEVQGVLELDYSNRYDQNKLTVLLKKFMNKYIFGWPNEGIIGSIWGDELYYKTLKVLEVAKEVLDMEMRGNAYYDMW